VFRTEYNCCLLHFFCSPSCAGFFLVRYTSAAVRFQLKFDFTAHKANLPLSVFVVEYGGLQTTCLSELYLPKLSMLCSTYLLALSYFIQLDVRLDYLFFMDTTLCILRRWVSLSYACIRFWSSPNFKFQPHPMQSSHLAGASHVFWCPRVLRLTMFCPTSACCLPVSTALFIET